MLLRYSRGDSLTSFFFVFFSLSFVSRALSSMAEGSLAQNHRREQVAVFSARHVSTVVVVVVVVVVV